MLSSAEIAHRMKFSAQEPPPVIPPPPALTDPAGAPPLPPPLSGPPQVDPGSQPPTLPAPPDPAQPGQIAPAAPSSDEMLRQALIEAIGDDFDPEDAGFQHGSESIAPGMKEHVVKPMDVNAPRSLPGQREMEGVFRDLEPGEAKPPKSHHDHSHQHRHHTERLPESRLESLPPLNGPKTEVSSPTAVDREMLDRHWDESTKDHRPKLSASKIAEALGLRTTELRPDF